MPRPARTMPVFRFESTHAIDSMIDRTRMSSDDLVEVLNKGRCIWLNSPERHWQRRAYLLMYSIADAAFFVVIVAMDEGENIASIVTVLTQQHYENDRGAIYRHILLRAMNASLVAEEVIESWKLAHPAPTTRRSERAQAAWQVKLERRARRLSILVDYTTDSGVFERVVLQDPPGHDAEVVAADDAKVVDQAGFWDWFAQQVADKGVPLERVLALKAQRAGRDPVPLLTTA